MNRSNSCIFCTVKIETLRIYTPKPEELAAWYKKYFGVNTFTEKAVKTDEENSVALQFGSSRLLLEPSEQDGSYHFAINIPSDQLENARMFLRGFTELLPDPDTGSEVIDFTAWNAHAMYFRDPAGNIVELIARHSLRDKNPKGFGPECLRCISEIGTPTISVQSAFNTLHDSLGIARYSGNFTTFCAAGDEIGLIILTELDRNWFPTDTPSLPEPWQMDGSRHGKPFTLLFENGKLQVVR